MVRNREVMAERKLEKSETDEEKKAEKWRRGK